MDLEYRPADTMSRAVSAVIAVVTTVVILWLIFTIAGDYYIAGEQVAGTQASSMAHQERTTHSNAASGAHT